MSHSPRIAVIGTGHIGGTLGRRLQEAGYDVVFGARDAATARQKLQNVEVPLLSPADAVRGAGIVFLTVPAAAAVDAARGLNLGPGTILVDCTNPLRWDGGPAWASTTSVRRSTAIRRSVARRRAAAQRGDSRNLTVLWLHLAHTGKGRHFAFKAVGR